MTEVWGNLGKALDNNQTINEAINEAIVSHEQDPTAHLGAGESLQAHKSDEIIDHPAKSVVSDKYDDFSIDPIKIKNDMFHVFIDWATVDALTVTGSTGFGKFLSHGLAIFDVPAGVGKYIQITNYASLVPWNPADLTPFFYTKFLVLPQSGMTAYIGMGNIAEQFVGFKILTNKMYACYINGGTQHTQVINNINMQIFHDYKAIIDSEKNILFYIDNVLVYQVNYTFSEMLEDQTNLFIKVTNTQAGLTCGLYICEYNYYSKFS